MPVPDEEKPEPKPKWPARLDTFIRRTRKFMVSNGSAEAYMDYCIAAEYVLCRTGGVSRDELKAALEWEFTKGPTSKQAGYTEEEVG